MALEADRNQIAVVIGAAMCFGFDVVNRSCRDWSAACQALLADVTITFKNAGADDVPLTAITTLVAAKSALMLLPPFVTVRLTVSGTVCGSAGAPAFTAGARDSCWHIFGPNKEATSNSQWLTAERLSLVRVRGA